MKNSRKLKFGLVVGLVLVGVVSGIDFNKIDADFDITINSFTSDVEPISGLWTYYTTTITSPVNKTVILSFDIYPESNSSHPDRHHGYFTKQVSFSAGETKTIRVRYNWQGKAQYDLGDGWGAADDTWQNLSCCGYTDYNMQFIVWENGNIITNKSIAQNLKPLDKKVLTYYFYWYDGKTGDHIWCPDGVQDMLGNGPIYGKGSWFSWQNSDLHKVEFARMKRSGIDIAMPVYWGDCSNTCNFGGDCPPEGKWSDKGLDKMVEALDELESENKDHPLIGMFYDTSANALQYSACERDCSMWYDYDICPVPSLYDARNREVFYQMIKDFYTKIPDKYVAKIGGRYIVWLYCAVPFSDIDCSAFDYARDKFKEDFGKELLIVANRNFGSCDSIEAYGTYSEGVFNLPHPPTDKLDICAAAAGYDHSALTKPEYGGCGPREPLVVDRKNGQTYLDDWDECIANNEGWIVIDGGWNEFHEGSDISPSEQYGLKYLELTNQKVREFKGNAPIWHECESNDECIKDCVKYECVSNECTSTIIDNNVCPKEYDFSISGFNSFPEEMNVGTTLSIPTEITNNGTEIWTQGGNNPVRISYHWKQNGEYIVFDGLRTFLPKDIAHGESFTVPIVIRTPNSSGTYTLMIDIVKEGKFWFSGFVKPKIYEKTVNISDNNECNSNGTDGFGKCSHNCGASVGCEGTDPNSCSTNSLKKCDSNCQEISSCGDGACNCGENAGNCLEDCQIVNHFPIGSLDSADQTLITGWAYDEDSNSNPINVHIYIDGNLIDSTIASQPRPDLVSAGVCPDPNHGFSFSTPTDLSVGNHTVNAYAINQPEGTNPELIGSPIIFNILNIDPDPDPDPTPDPNPDPILPSFPEQTLLKTPNSFKIYIIINQKKKWIPTPEVFETLGYQWTNITIIDKNELTLIPDYEDNLIRATNDYKVYLIVNGIKRHIPNSEIFLNYGFEWNDIKEVNQETINQYKTSLLIKESKKQETYYLCPIRKIKRWLRSPEIFNSYNNKWKDIQVISKYEMDSYPTSNLIKLNNSNDIYLIEGNKKRLINSVEEFEREGLDWEKVMGVNEREWEWFE